MQFPARGAILAVAAVAVVSALFACSTETIVSAPANGIAPAAPSPEEEVDGGPASPDPLTWASSCRGTYECPDGTECVRTAGAKRGVCLHQCTIVPGSCPKGESCVKGICAPPCTGGCPAQSVCSEGQCFATCKDRADICGTGTSCTETSGGAVCKSAEPVDPPPTCQPPTTTATSGVSPAKTVATLSDAEKGTLCDWQNGRLGGYGCTKKCGGGVDTTNKANQAACKAAMKPTCTVTVAQTEACVLALAPNPCDIATALAGACKPLVDTPGCM